MKAKGQKLTRKDKDAIISKALENPYAYLEPEDTSFPLGQVYRAFQHHPVWAVQKIGISLQFQERRVLKMVERDRNFTLMIMVHHLIRHRWWSLPGPGGVMASIQVYGGFARSAMMAHAACRKTVLTFMLCWKRRGWPRDISRLIGKQVMASQYDDFTWFQDDVSDLDLLVSYHGGHKPDETQFYQDVEHIQLELSKSTDCRLYRKTDLLLQISCV